MDRGIFAAEPVANYGGVPILYEDNHLLVAVKPPNMPAQEDASGDMDILRLMKRYIGEKFEKPGNVYLGLVHRLDRPVGGLMVLARTSKAAGRLGAQVREKALGRDYLAVVRGNPPKAGRLEDWLLKDGPANTVGVVPEGTPGAKRAALTYGALGAKEGLGLLRIALETGRSHQIRVQCANAGLPLWGDARYGGGRPGEQIGLWGAGLSFTHPTLKVPVTALAPPPADTAPWGLFEGEIAGFVEGMKEAR